VIYAGIDEAGYGPMLGPLCVGMSAWSVGGDEGAGPPCLWRALRRCAARRPGDRRGRIAIADSKRLKGAGSGHPLRHLERGVLAMLRVLARSAVDDASLLGSLGARLGSASWYAGEPLALPVALSHPELDVDSNLLRSGMEDSGSRLLDLRCCALCESEFNGVVRETGSKAEATIRAIGTHLRHLRALADSMGEHLVVACDRLGGRSAYGVVLARELAGAGVTVIHEGDRASSYAARDGDRRMKVIFETDGEEAHLPVAAASMVAKYVRELAMARFNRYWCARVAELKPTAGYYADARRWLRDAGAHLSREERTALVRLA
jgi:hypothetical protein